MAVQCGMCSSFRAHRRCAAPGALSLPLSCLRSRPPSSLLSRTSRRQSARITPHPPWLTHSPSLAMMSTWSVCRRSTVVTWGPGEGTQLHAFTYVN